jgi:hypothetical protein
VAIKMGYSIAIHCKSDKLRKKMSQFIKKNYTGASTLFGKDKVDHEAVQFMPGGSMSYDHGKCSLGFDYSSWINHFERPYVNSVLRWMAIQVGKKKILYDPDSKRTPGLKGKHFFTVYDGDEDCPVVIKSKNAPFVLLECEWCPVDELGYHPLDYKNPSDSARWNRHLKVLQKFMGMPFEQYNKIVREELKRLDDLWKKQEEK